MSLWFLAFGGTIPIGNLIFGPVIDQFGAQSMLLISAGWSLVLFWWCNLVKVDEKFPKGLELPEN
jgi:MFS family permease